MNNPYAYQNVKNSQMQAPKHLKYGINKFKWTCVPLVLCCWIYGKHQMGLWAINAQEGGFYVRSIASSAFTSHICFVIYSLCSILEKLWVSLWFLPSALNHGSLKKDWEKIITHVNWALVMIGTVPGAHHSFRTL